MVKKKTAIQCDNVSQQKDIFDITKYILCFFIVAIHCSLFPRYLMPWLRLAVPLFFIISSFLLCEKLSVAPREHHWSIVKKYIFRNLALYAFWFVVLLPITIYGRRVWWDGNVLSSVYRIISNTLFASTFLDSWFIVGCIMGSLVIFLCYRKNIVVSFIIMFVCLVFVCFMTTYSFCFDGLSFFQQFKKAYFLIFQDPQYSFPVAFVYMLIGLIISRLNILLSRRMLVVCISLFLISLICLYFEWFFISNKTNSINYSTYFSIPICSSLAFILIKQIKINLHFAKILRKISVISFASHHSIKCVLEEIFARILPSDKEVFLTIVLFFSVVLLCHVLSFLIFWLEKYKYMRLLRFSH